MVTIFKCPDLKACRGGSMESGGLGCNLRFRSCLPAMLPKRPSV